MRRLVIAWTASLLIGLVAVAPAAAASAQQRPYRDSGTADYLWAWASDCTAGGRCTDIFVDAAIVDLQGGDAFAYVCVSIYSGRAGAWGCADAAVTIASDLSSASVGPTTVLVESCGPRRCSTQEVTVSAELDAVAEPNGYSRTERYEYGDCTDTFRVRGEASEATGTIVYDGTSFEAGGQIGSDQFSFSSRC